MTNVFDYYDKDSYLSHHGIKGQKWGVRRFQNSDGSLTAAGEKRYNVTSAAGATKNLNKIEKQNAKLVTKAAVAKIKAEKAYQKGRDKKYKKLMETSKAATEASEAGKKVANKIINDAKNKGYRVSSISKTRYTHTGRLILGHMLAGPLGTAAVGGLDIYRAKTYGDVAGGIVEGKKYNVIREH